MVPVQVLQGQVDPAFYQVHPDVLPEVGQLERGTRSVGQDLAFSVPVAAQIEHEMAHRIGRVPTVFEHIRVGPVTRYDLVLPERGQQVSKRGYGYLETVDRLPECDEYRMPGAAVVTGLQLGVPPFEQFQGQAGIAGLVGEVVGPPAVGVDMVEMPPQRGGQEPGNDDEILVVLASEATAVPGGGRQRGVADAGQRVEGEVIEPAHGFRQVVG